MPSQNKHYEPLAIVSSTATLNGLATILDVSQEMQLASGAFGSTVSTAATPSSQEQLKLPRAIFSTSIRLSDGRKHKMPHTTKFHVL